MSQAARPLRPWDRPGAWLLEDVWPPLMWRMEPLYHLAAALWRRRLRRTTFVAIGGSLGKTTAKELTAAALATAGPTARSFRNQNSGVRVAGNLLAVRRHDLFAVQELSAGRPGHVGRAARLVQPRVAVMLGVRGTHTAAYASQEARAAEKAKLLDALPPDGVAILNGDDPLVAGMAGRVRGRVVTFGESPGCDLVASEVSARFPDRLTCLVRFRDGHEQRVATRLVGAHWVPAVLGSLAVAWVLGVDLERAAAAMEAVEPFPGRMQPRELPNGAVILRDDNNASLDATRPALAVMAEARARRRIVALTDISDAGGHRKERLKLIAPLLASSADVVILIGEGAGYGRNRLIEAGLAAGSALAFATLREAAGHLRLELRAGDLALVKGRTTDHAARLFHAQLGDVACWKTRCGKHSLCDDCWQLGRGSPPSVPGPAA